MVGLMTAALGTASAGPREWAGFGAALAGIALVAGSGGHASWEGDALMLGSAVLSAAMIVAQTALLPGRDAIAVTAVQMAAATAAVLPVALIAGSAPVAAPTLHQLISAAGLVTIGSLVPFTLYAYGQARTSAEVAGAFVNLEPLVGVSLGAAAFGDPFGAASLAGGLTILVGIALCVAVPAGAKRTGELP
jgi:drug/metabolite transporter (DMT)-like permease